MGAQLNRAPTRQTFLVVALEREIERLFPGRNPVAVSLLLL